MIKVFRRRVSSWTFLAFTAAMSLIIAGALALNKPLPEYLVARGNLLPGDRLNEGSFQPIRLDLAELGENYITLDDLEPELVVAETILSGELIPRNNLSNTPIPGFTNIVLESSLPISELVKPGSWVQIWRTVSGPQGFTSELLVARSQVRSVHEDQSFASEKRAWVEVLVSQEQASLLLETLSAELNIYLLVAL